MNEQEDLTVQDERFDDDYQEIQEDFVDQQEAENNVVDFPNDEETAMSEDAQETLDNITSEEAEVEEVESEQEEKETTEGIKLATPDQFNGDFEKALAVNMDKLAAVNDQVIIDAIEGLTQIDEQRAELNEEANHIRATVKKAGIPIAALNAAYARSKTTDAYKARIDAAYAKCCKALGIGYQLGLFK